MSKELDALTKIVDTYYIDNMDKEISIIETALNDYEILKNDFISMKDFKYEQLDAFEIIKKKQVDVHYLLICIEQNINPLQFYNEYMKEHNALCLTQEEFDLLKKTLIE